MTIRKTYSHVVEGFEIYTLLQDKEDVIPVHESSRHPLPKYYMMNFTMNYMVGPMRALPMQYNAIKKIWRGEL